MIHRELSIYLLYSRLIFAYSLIQVFCFLNVNDRNNKSLRHKLIKNDRFLKPIFK